MLAGFDLLLFCCGIFAVHTTFNRCWKQAWLLAERNTTFGKNVFCDAIPSVETGILTSVAIRHLIGHGIGILQGIGAVGFNRFYVTPKNMSKDTRKFEPDAMRVLASEAAQQCDSFGGGIDPHWITHAHTGSIH